MDFPRFVYRLGAAGLRKPQSRLVCDKASYDKALSDGWFKNVTEALSGNATSDAVEIKEKRGPGRPRKTGVSTTPIAPEIEDDDIPPSAFERG